MTKTHIKNSRFLPLVSLLAICLLSACIASGQVNNNEPLNTVATDIALPSPSATPVIIWFPATATWTPFPTTEPSATPIPFPGLGPQTFSDDFSQIENWTQAETAGSGGNSIILNRNRLTLAANVTPVSLISMNKSVILGDFYASISVNVNRCAGQDEYGLLYRAGSEAYGYRFLLNCTGQARVERIRDSVAFPLQNWLASGDAPSGAPGSVKMGVWVAGSEMRFFLNDHYQFSVFDQLFKSGGFGVFINAGSQEGMNIGFSDLAIYSVDYVSPTPTATPSKTPTPSRTPRP